MGNSIYKNQSHLPHKNNTGTTRIEQNGTLNRNFIMNSIEEEKKKSNMKPTEGGVKFSLYMRDFSFSIGIL